MGCPLTTEFKFSMPSPIAEYLMNRDHIVGGMSDKSLSILNESQLIETLVGVYLGLVAQTDRLFAGKGLGVDAWSWDWAMTGVSNHLSRNLSHQMRMVWERWMADMGLRVSLVEVPSREPEWLRPVADLAFGSCRIEPWVLEVLMRGELYASPRPGPDLGERVDFDTAPDGMWGVLRDITSYSDSLTFVSSNDVEYYSGVRTYRVFVVGPSHMPSQVRGAPMLMDALQYSIPGWNGEKTLFRSVNVVPLVGRSGSYRAYLETPHHAQSGPLQSLGTCHQPMGVTRSINTDSLTANLDRIGSFFRS
jgi:hypothetical protein